MGIMVFGKKKIKFTATPGTSEDLIFGNISSALHVKNPKEWGIEVDVNRKGEVEIKTPPAHFDDIEAELVALGYKNKKK